MVDLQALADGIHRDADGIWYARHRARVSYPDDGNALCAELEDASFWFGHRNRCILSLVRAWPPGGAIFDVGGGNGFVSRALVDAGFESVVVEPGPVGARECRDRGLEHVVCATLDDAQFRSGSLPAVGLFDVIEHIEDDVAFMRGVHAAMISGGRVYITVPAYAWLWSAEDVAAGHYRRHTIGSMTSLLDASGFRVDFATYIFRFLPLPIFLLRSLPHRLGFRRPPAGDIQAARRDHDAGSGSIGRTIEWMLEPEIRHIERSRSMRFGGSCLIAASKR